jgi:hypothetical protein
MHNVCRRTIGLVLPGLCATCAVFAADLVFSGALQEVTAKSLTIRISRGVFADAQLPRTGSLAAKEIAARYNLADQVQITLKPSLELKKLVRLRPASADELALVSTLMISAMSGQLENLLKHSDPPARAAQDPSEARSEFEQARLVNLERARNLPGFVADETVKRYIARQSSPDAWKQVDIVESEVTFKGSQPAREHVRINGKPWTKPSFPGIDWSVDFGTELKPVFDPACPNSFEFEGRRELGGRELLTYRYSAPPESCFGYGQNGAKRFFPSRTGRIFIDPAGKLIQYEEEANQYPPESGLAGFKEITRWDYVRIGDGFWLLPAGYEMICRFSSGELWHLVGEFKNHRHFESSTTVTFQQ